MWIAGVATHHLLIKYSLIQKTYRTSMTESDDELAELQGRLEQLRTEHRDLDDVIARLVEKAPFDQLQLQRLKKRKLGLKDMMARIEDELHPDIIA